MPIDLVRQNIPDAADPQQGPEPTLCSMTNGISVVQITFLGGFGEPDPGNEIVADLGEKAWIEEQFVGDAYLVIFLGVDDHGTYQTMYVEYAGHDGVSNKDDAIAVARQIIATLQG